jgi:hypothetical protein
MSSSADVLCDAKIGAAAARLQVSRGQTADRASIPTATAILMLLSSTSSRSTPSRGI